MFQRLYKSRNMTEKQARRFLNGNNTVLPFFGFTCREVDLDASEKVPFAEEQAPRNATKEKSGNAASSKCVIFSRDEVPTGSALELEEKILGLLSKDKRFQDREGNFDPFQTPYLSPSLFDFYNDHAFYMKKIFDIFTLLLIPLVGLIVWMIADFAEYASWNWVLFGASCAYSATLLITYRVMMNKKRKENSFFTLAPEDRKKIQDQYLESLEIGVEEVDELLKEYARLMKSLY